MKAVKQNSLWKKYSLCVGGTWGVWLILTAVIYFLALGPQNILMARLQKEFAVSNEEISMAQKAGRPETRANMEQRLQAAAQKTAYFVVAQENTAGLVLQISQLAAKHQLQEFSTRIGTGSSAPKENEKLKITEAWLELAFSGTFPQIASFINSLERNDPVVFIENVDIKRTQRENGLSSASIQISYLTRNSEIKKTQPVSSGNLDSDNKKDLLH